MNKYVFISLLFCLTHITNSAQITVYTSDDNEEYPVFEVEEMYPEEIKSYNSFIKQGMPEKTALLYINAGRAQDNLIYAPATIIDYDFKPEITEEDSIPDAIGAIGVWVTLINTTPKTIKEITLEFEFEFADSPVYDIKTGNSYLVLKFSNLKGRTKSDRYSVIVENLLSCYHLLSYKDATYKKLFYNKKATVIKLHSARIKYTDGSTSNKIAVFSEGYSNDETLLNSGPLAPVIKFLNATRQ